MIYRIGMNTDLNCDGIQNEEYFFNLVAEIANSQLGVDIIK